VLTNKNSPLPKLGQGVPQDDLSSSFYDLDDMHILNLKIIEDIKFQRGLSVKQILEIFSLDILIMFSCVLTIETIASGHREFFQICMLAEQVMRMKWRFGIKVKINFLKFPKFLD
jgi:hypothetical protein